MRPWINWILIISFTAFVLSCSTGEKKEKSIDTVAYHCNAEEIAINDNKFIETHSKKAFFQNPETQSSDFFYSGQYACKIYPGRPYALTCEIKNVKPDDFLKVTVWRKTTNNTGLIVIDGGEGFYTADRKIIETGKQGWEKIMAEFHVPPNFYAKKVKIYTWCNGQDTVYFDDIQIIHQKNKKYPVYELQDGIHLHTDGNNLAKFSKIRLSAFESTVLVNSDEDYSSLVVFDGHNFLNGDFRLKGDLVDHLQGEKWSFRIKLKKEFAWKNLRTFSIQNPSTRNFLHEWFAHKIFEQEDVLTTRYGFTPVKLNNKSLGIYAWEEHFEKHLVENKNRREGPIIRFDESLMWQRVLETKKTQRQWDIDYFGAARIIPFKVGRTTSDSLLSLQFVEAQKLLWQYKNRTKSASEIFDIRLLAKYYALIDLTQAYHGFTWHNQRFYYNPVTCLLEPIAFDGYMEDGIYKRFDEQLTGLLSPNKIESFRKEELMLFQVFADPIFRKNYIDYLSRYSTPEFINDLKSKYHAESDSLSKLLQIEFPYFNFDFDFIQTQAEFIRNNIEEINSNSTQIGLALTKIQSKQFIKSYTSDVNANLIPHQVHAYYNQSDNSIEVLNFHNSEVNILGVFIESGLPQAFDEKPKLTAYNGQSLSRIRLSVSGVPVKVLCEIENEMFETEVNNWTFNTKNTARQNTVNNILPENVAVTGDQIIFDGSYQFSNSISIPDSFIVVAKPGTKIDLINGASFLCFSPLRFQGTQEMPVKIISSDNSANGFNILQPNGKSTLQHVQFSGLSNLRKQGWQTPSAVTFYEADVDFNACTFENNSNCDDALNVVRSEFNATDCVFKNTFADAFDSDFCTGEVSNCTFTNIGNDAIDFSGSRVKITNCSMNEVGDKAISGGENSTLFVSECEINGANIGVAAKDLSQLELDKIILNNTLYGIVAFVKKPEYGSANVTIDNLKMKNNVVFHQIELGSTLTLNGKLIEGREKNLAVKLYQ